MFEILGGVESKAIRRIRELESQLSTALSLSSAYREALEEIALYGNVVSPTGSMVRSIVDIARAALDRKPGEPVGREVTLEEMEEEVRETLTDVLHSSHHWVLPVVFSALLKTFRVERR